MSLTAREEKFCQEFVKCRNAFQAALLSDYKFCESAINFYVYFLIHPISGHIFYIGKGKDKRKDAHLRNFLNNKPDSNSLKKSTIAAIMKSNLDPLAVIFKNNLREQEAYDIESSLIKLFADCDLTNISSGLLSQIEKSKIEAKICLDKIIPFDKWKLLRQPTNLEVHHYRKIKTELKRISIAGSPVSIIETKSSKGKCVSYE